MKRLVNKIRVIIDKLLLDYWWRIPFLSIDVTWRHDFPTKRLVEHCLENYLIESGNRISSKLSQVAHAYSYDSTVTKSNLDSIHLIHGTLSRERVRQMLCKFVRQHYRR